MAYINGAVNEWETVGVPLTQGVDLNTRVRLVEPQKLLRATNAYFPRNGGPEKRKGHTATPVAYGTTTQPPTTETHLYGWGWIDIDNPVADPRPSFPYSGNLLGIAKRDSEVVVWDGSSMYVEGRTDEPLKAYIPFAITSPIAKIAASHNYSDVGDNGTTRVVTVRDLQNASVRIFVYDSESGALRFESGMSVSDPEFLYVVPCGVRVHIFVQDTSANVIYHSYAQDGISYLAEQQELGVDVGAHFDVQRCASDMMILAYVDTSQAVRFMYIRDTGEVDDILVAANTELDLDGSLALRVAITKHPISNEVGLIWGASGNAQYCRIYEEDGTNISSRLSFALDTDNKKVAITSNYTVDDSGRGTFYGYSDKTTSGDTFVRMRSFQTTGSGLGDGGGTGTVVSVAQRYNVNLISHAFRVGNVPFVFVVFPSDFQTTYLLLDERLYPCGKLEYGTANNNTADPWTFSVNWIDGLLSTEFHCGLMYKQRVIDVDGVFHEVGTKFCQLDFLPEFRPAQAGRALYFPGAQLWMYDGRSLTEQGFHFTPEDLTYTPGTIVGGAMTGGATHKYRIYPCWKNAQGEEVRGPALLSEDVDLGGADTGVEIDITTLPTCREDAYFLVYRNVNAGVLWYLVSDRDPASDNCPKNNLGVSSVQFVDTVSDTDLLSRELDPANAAGYLHSFSAPACEVIAYGKDRLWLAGGELSKGTILPSRLFYENEAPSFHGNLAYSVDRDANPFTAIGFVADYVVAFKEDRAYIITGDAADNTSQGDNLRNQLALSDVGCVAHNSLVRLTAGLAFQSAGGIRLLSAGGAVVNIGLDVDTQVDYITSAVLDTQNRLVKFYQATGDTLVFDYEGGQWTTWTLRTSSAIPGKLVHDFYIWTEDDVYTDADANYLYTIRSANLNTVLGGFQRARRVGGFGEADQNYTVTIRTYLDGSNDFSEQWEWDSSEDLNSSTWGGGTWGSGFWGDSGATTLYSRDSIWRWKHRCSRQKCSSISIEIEYNGPDRGPVHVALLVEVGRKPGFDRQSK